MDAYDGGDRHRLKEPIDLREFTQTGSSTFEVENMINPLDNIFEDAMTEDMEHKKDFFKDISLKNIGIISRSAQNAMTDFDELQNTMEEIHDGIKKKVKRPGRGVKLTPGTKVWIHYSAYLEYADEPFDTSVDKSRPYSFTVGQGGVIPGFDIAVASMEVREIADFLIPPEYAYGKLGCEPRIPQDARVLFTIEVLDHQVVSKYAQIFEMSDEERNELPFDEIYKATEELKTCGKIEYEARKYSEAVVMYSRAAKMLENYLLTTSEEENRKNVIIYNIFNNLAICYLRLEKPHKSINASKAALAIPIVDLKKDKPYYLMAKAYLSLGKIEQAKTEINEANRICPNNLETTRLYIQIMDKLHAENLEQKDLYKRMMALNVNGPAS